MFEPSRLEYGYSARKQSYWAIFEVPTLLTKINEAIVSIPGHSEVTIADKGILDDLNVELSLEIDSFDFWTYVDSFYQNNKDFFSKELIISLEKTAKGSITLYFKPKDSNVIASDANDYWKKLIRSKVLPKHLIKEFSRLDYWILKDIEWLIDIKLPDDSSFVIEEE